MTGPIRISLSAFQQRRFAELRAQAQELSARQSEAVTAIIAGEHDPETVAMWRVTLDVDAIVCTPPDQAAT